MFEVLLDDLLSALETRGIDTSKLHLVDESDTDDEPRDLIIRSRSVVVIALPCHGRDRGFNSLRDRLLVYKCELHVYVSNVLVVQKLGSNPIFDIISNFVLIF